MSCPLAPDSRYLIPDQSFGYTDFFANLFKTNIFLLITFEPCLGVRCNQTDTPFSGVRVHSGKGGVGGVCRRTSGK